MSDPETPEPKVIWVEMTAAQWAELKALASEAVGVDIGLPRSFETLPNGNVRHSISGTTGMLFEALAKARGLSIPDLILSLARERAKSQRTAKSEKQRKSQEVLKEFLTSCPSPTEIFLIGITLTQETMVQDKKDMTIAVGGSVESLAEVVQSLAEAYGSMGGTTYLQLMEEFSRRLSEAFKANGISHSTTSTQKGGAPTPMSVN